MLLSEVCATPASGTPHVSAGQTAKDGGGGATRGRVDKKPLHDETCCAFRVLPEPYVPLR
eukprot:249376-Rhodomonas_salina.1